MFSVVGLESVRTSTDYQMTVEVVEMAGGSNIVGSNYNQFYSHQFSLGGATEGRSDSAQISQSHVGIESGYLPQLSNPAFPGIFALSRPVGLNAKVLLSDLLAVATNPDNSSLRILVDRVTDGGGTATKGTRFISYQAPAGPSVPDVIHYQLIDAWGDQQNGQISVVILPPPDRTTFNQVLLQFLPNGGAHVVFVGALSQVYQIQVTDSLIPPVHWSNLPTSPSSVQPGFFEATDPFGGSGSQRFYRSVSL